MFSTLSLKLAVKRESKQRRTSLRRLGHSSLLFLCDGHARRLPPSRPPLTCLLPPHALLPLQLLSLPFCVLEFEVSVAGKEKKNNNNIENQVISASLRATAAHCPPPPPSETVTFIQQLALCSSSICVEKKSGQPDGSPGFTSLRLWAAGWSAPCTANWKP